MKIEKEDILTPANLATILGLALTIHGATQLNTVQGVAEIGVGRVLDLLDGPIARATHASRLGAMLDASADKLATFAILASAWHYDVAPKTMIGLIAAQNIINAGISLYAEHHDKNMESSLAGKRAMFLQNLAVGGYALAGVVGSDTIQNGLEATSLVAGVAGLAVGALATYGYLRQAASSD